MSNTPGSPYGDLPPTEDAATALDVKDPHEHHWFQAPTKEVGPRFVGGLVFAQFVFFVALLGPAIIGIGVKVQSIVPDAEKAATREEQGRVEPRDPAAHDQRLDVRGAQYMNPRPKLMAFA